MRCKEIDEGFIGEGYRGRGRLGSSRRGRDEAVFVDGRDSGVVLRQQREDEGGRPRGEDVDVVESERAEENKGQRREKQRRR